MAMGKLVIDRNCSSLSSVATMLVAVLILLDATISTDAASAMTVWSNKGCDGLRRVLLQCGCSEFYDEADGVYWNNGYQFEYDGQTAALYNSEGCQGVAHFHLGADAGSCGTFGWKSIWIQC